MTKTCDLENRLVMITGGAGGMGRSMASRLLQRGARCLLVDIDPASLDSAARQLGPGVQCHRADLTKLDEVRALLAEVERTHGRLDVLINNAAVTVTGAFEERPVERIVGELNVNLVAPLVLTRLAIPLLRRAPDPRVISIASLGAMFPLPETTVYSASKFGLRGAMLCLGLDGPRMGITFSVVSPSATETPMLIREAIDNGNRLQFMDPPQSPHEVAEQVMRALDHPRLERYVRESESWLVRLVMLLPNLLPRLIPLFASKGEQGHRRYLKSLAERGLIEQRDGCWQMAEPNPSWRSPHV